MSNDLDIYNEYEPPKTAGLFLKLEDGETAKVRLVSLPIIFQNTFKRGDEESISTRYAWLVWNHEENRPQIWQTNAATYGQISDLVKDEDYGDHREYDVKITRNGEGPQTRYTVRPGVKRYALEDEQLEQCNNIDPIAIIDKADSSQFVMWLADYHKAKAEGAERKKANSIEGAENPGYASAKAKADALKNKKNVDKAFNSEDGPIDMPDGFGLKDDDPRNNKDEEGDF